MKLILIPITLAIAATCSPSQQTAISAIESTALSAGIGYLQGGTTGAIAGAAPSLLNDVNLAALAIRSQQSPAGTPQVSPVASEITTAIQVISASPQVAKVLGPTATQIVKAVASGKVTPNVALETAAVGLDKAAAAGAAK